MKKKQIPHEALVNLKQRLNLLPNRCVERRHLIQHVAELYGVSLASVYRALRNYTRPQLLRRTDAGQPRKLPKTRLLYFCEIIAALKIRTRNKKNRHMSTVRALQILEEHGVEASNQFVKAPKGLLSKTTVNRYLKQWGYDFNRLIRQPPAVRFQATHSNQCWQFDLSPSEVKHVEHPLWYEKNKGNPTLMIYSVVDDRSGVIYMEYRCVYGEDVEAALRFLYNAMRSKTEDFMLQGIPEMIYMDNGPIAKSAIFQRVMQYLGIEVKTHLPAGKDGRRTTARAKGKCERQLRTIKDAQEILYHFHKPDSEAEANMWMVHYVQCQNQREHRSEEHSCFEDWKCNLPPGGLKEICSWERYCTFAREPERRKVGIDARVSIHGIQYEVDPDLAEESVLLWWGLFDTELYVEHGEQRYGPYYPVSGPIPLHKYRSFKKTKSQERADRIEALADSLGLPKAVLEGYEDTKKPADSLPRVAFRDPDPFNEFSYPTLIAAKQAIAAYLRTPLALLDAEELRFIDQVLAKSLNKKEVIAQMKVHFQPV